MFSEYVLFKKKKIPNLVCYKILSLKNVALCLKVPDFNSLKEEGNNLFKEGKIAEALDVYTKALGIVDIKAGDKAVILKNRAACHLKEEEYQAVIDDCSAGTWVIHFNCSFSPIETSGYSLMRNGTPQCCSIISLEIN